MDFSAILDQLFTDEVRMALMVLALLVCVLYLITVIWVIRDSYLRGSVPILWGLIALIPFLGAFAYSMMRPPMLQSDRDEQALDFALKQRELLRFGECAKCGYPVEREYLMCPRCTTQLKNECYRCGHALNPDWTVCPYCCTPVGE